MPPHSTTRVIVSAETAISPGSKVPNSTMERRLMSR